MAYELPAGSMTTKEEALLSLNGPRFPAPAPNQWILKLVEQAHEAVIGWEYLGRSKFCVVKISPMWGRSAYGLLM